MYRSSLPTLRTFIQHMEELAKEHGDDTPVVTAGETSKVFAPSTAMAVIETHEQEWKVNLVDLGRTPDSVLRDAVRGLNSEATHGTFEVAVRIL